MLSRTLYCKPQKLLKFNNRWATILTTQLEKKAALALLCSLINTMATYDPVGWAALPYNHLLFGDINEPLVLACVQTLVALLDYRSWEPAATESSAKTTRPTEDQIDDLAKSTQRLHISGASNDFRHYLSKLHRPSDFQVIAVGITRLLRNPLDAAKSYLPGSTKKVGLTSELMTLLWMLMDTNEDFVRHIVELPFILVVVEAVLGVCLDARKDQFGPMRPTILSLQEPFMVILSNVSPLVKSLTATTANKLLSLLDVFSSPAFLLSKEHNHRLLFHLIDIFNNIVQYQFAGNAQIVYSLVRHQTKIISLSQLTLDVAIAEVERLRQNELDKQAARSLTAKPSSDTLSSAPVSVSTPQSQQLDGSSSSQPQTPTASTPQRVLSEKARGKLPAVESDELTLATPDQAIATNPPAEFVSNSGFKPTLAWFSSWHPHLPLLTLLTLADHMRPRIELFCLENDLNDDRRVIEFLSKETVVGVLPQPHPIMMRRFVNSDAMHVWFTSFFWGLVYLKGSEATDAETAKLCPPIWIGTAVSLFQLHFKK
eukprot:jgi/Hompol1/5153/HPOL_001125-RA